MKSKNLKIPVVIIIIGIVAAISAHLLTSVQLKPSVTEQDFNYSVTYKVDGETKTVEGVYTCRFIGFGDGGIDPLERYYEGEYTVDGQTSFSRSYNIAEKDNYKLEIITLFNDSYLMGDTKNEYYHPSLEDPCIEATDEMGNQYSETDMPIDFDVEIVSWDYPEPIKNSFVFAGFAGFHVYSTVAMLLTGLLTLILCVIFAKKAEGYKYGVLDILGIVFNFIILLVVIPIISLTAWLIQAFPTAADWIYQAYLLIPPIVMYTLAISVALRRKCFRKSGFIVQFLGIVMFVVTVICEYVL